jgi:hypothetical protein
VPERRQIYVFLPIAFTFLFILIFLFFFISILLVFFTSFICVFFRFLSYFLPSILLLIVCFLFCALTYYFSSDSSSSFFSLLVILFSDLLYFHSFHLLLRYCICYNCLLAFCYFVSSYTTNPTS